MTSQEPVTLSRAIEIAVAHHQAGRLSEAEAVYRQILTVDSDYFDALHLLGVIAHQNGKHEEAIELIDKATRKDPSAFAALNNLGLAYRALNELEQAGACFQKARALNPDYVEARNNLALVFQAQGRLDDAVTEFQEVLARRAAFADGHNNLGGVLHVQGKLPEAIACYQKALSLNPDFPEAHFNLAKAFEARGDRAAALAGYQEAILLKPELAEAHFCLGSMLQAQGIIDEAIACFQTVLSLRPNYVEARWALAMSQVAIVYGAGDVPDDFRAAFSEALTELDEWFDASRIEDGFKAVGSQAPFYLSYQEQDNRGLLSQYGDLCARMMRHWQDKHGLAPQHRVRSETIRVGIVSAHIRDHSVWTAIIKGWCRHLDYRRFSLHVFYTGTVQDQETAIAKSQATYFLQGREGLRQWVDAILGQELDAIIYPEVGMDPMGLKLASLRLAPVQAATWGHPETTGLPTIDYYLSAEDFEPEGAQASYREQLIALPHLGCCYQPLQVTAVDPDIGAMGIDTELPLLLCPGTAYKYAPEHDWIFVEIARRLGRCQFIFFNDDQENLSEKLQSRLDVAFAQSDLYFPEYSVFIPWQRRPAFYGLLQRADVYLDTIGFSGFNTAMQAVECGLPIVTREGRFMRGRFAAGILRRMALSELVAKTDENYINVAVRLCQDTIHREHIRERIRSSRHILFDDIVAIRAFEEFLVSVVEEH
jgi:protein O-GlcNAc transferase